MNSVGLLPQDHFMVVKYVGHIKQCDGSCDAVSGGILELKWHNLLGYELGWLSSLRSLYSGKPY